LEGHKGAGFAISGESVHWMQFTDIAVIVRQSMSRVTLLELSKSSSQEANSNPFSPPPPPQALPLGPPFAESSREQLSNGNDSLKTLSINTTKTVGLLLLLSFVLFLRQHLTVWPRL
jgi:hypothetical protein